MRQRSRVDLVPEQFDELAVASARRKLRSPSMPLAASSAGSEADRDALLARGVEAFDVTDGGAARFG